MLWSAPRFSFVARHSLRWSVPLLWALAVGITGCGRSGIGNDPGSPQPCGVGMYRDPSGRCVFPDMAGGHSHFDLAGLDGLQGDDTGGDGSTGGDDGGMGGDDGGMGGDDGGMGGDDAGSCDQRREICNNGIDDNCDGQIDCDDPSCAADPHCATKGHEICNNGIDDDKNGLTDCQDPVCANFPGCQMGHMCDPMKVDCADPACVNQPQCRNLLCKPSVDFGVLQPTDSKSEKMISTVGTMDVAVTPCAPGGGGMLVTSFTVAKDNTAVRLDFTQEMGGDHVFALFRAGVNQPCDANPITCYDPHSTATGTTTWVLGSGTYYLIVQAFTKQHQSMLDVTLSTVSSKKKEICNNGVDDDGNGLTDCADPACFADNACKAKECNPDVNVGTLVLNDPPKQASFDTRNKGSKYNVQCAGGGGQDYAVEFSLQQTLGVLMNWDQMGDHVVGLYKLPPNGQNCDAQLLGCYDPSHRQMDLVAWGELPPGSYVFIFQAIKPGGEGHVDVELSAYLNRKVELCHNGIDDDGNGLVDCADPACFADAGCGAPVCTPDVNLGTLHLGDQQTTTVNTATGILNETVSCARGGGRAKIIEVTLAENAGMGFDCMESGDNVLGLFAAAGPRDSCDKSEIDCGDPKVIPFGCNYEIPNLQPGTYYVIVEAFKAGSEGKVTITLSSINDRSLEICNNGIDDDMDGFTDCKDKKCATSPYCMAKACKADVGIDPLPLNGMPVFKLVQTAGQQVSASPPCEVKPGGGDAVIYLNLPGPAGKLQVDYTQIGNHVFALYPDAGQGLQCDTLKPLQCTPSGGGMGGTVLFTKVPAGPYWLVIAADQPGDEGSASLKITATP